MADWSPQQERALKDVDCWLQATGDKPQVYRLFGYAGTGKTTLARHLVEAVHGSVYFAAFTGKAAHVLAQKGCPNPSTIHKLIYQPKDRGRMKLRELEVERAKLLTQNPVPQALLTQVDKAIAIERVNLKRPMFQLNSDSPLKRAALVVVDEASMVGNMMGEDLLSFGCPILALGDPAQLPPVQDRPFFSPNNPDTMLTEIHRQAADNPIIRMATTIRKGEFLKPGRYGQSNVFTRSELSREQLASIIQRTDQLLVGRNATRHASNARMRQLLGRSTSLPQKGDKLVCLRNDYELGVLNGQLWTCDEDGVGDEDQVFLQLSGESEGDRIQCHAHSAPFYGKEVDSWSRREAQEFDYGYALTVHKSQGSQWDDVVLLDEWTNQQTRRQWLYTGVTRAADRITVVKM